MIYGLIALAGSLALGLIVACIVIIRMQARDQSVPVSAQGKAQSSPTPKDMILDFCDEGSFIVDEDGTLSFVNPALLGLFGINKDSLDYYLHDDWKNLFSLEAQSELQNIMDDYVSEERYWRGEVRVSEGTIVDLQIRSMLEGGFIAIANDLSYQKQADQEHKDLQEQFFQAQKMEAIGRLAGGIAHDFNNILAAVNGYAEFLSQDLSDRPNEQKFANKILAATAQARDLVDHILTFSRKNNQDTEIVDVLKIIDENVSMIKATSDASIAIQKNIELSSYQSQIVANATQISQAIINLCVNALDAMEDEHGELNIAVVAPDRDFLNDNDMFRDHLPAAGDSPLVRINEKEGGRTILTSGTLARDHKYVCISVKDSGTGMGRAVMSHIFEPFFTTKPVNKGTGLGLATVHGVVSSHQGAMIIDTTIGKGTAFHLYFHTFEQEQQEAVVEEKQASSGGCFDGQSILLVEDQENVRDMTSSMLKRMGFAVTPTDSGIAALSILRQHKDQIPFDLILTDHSMPKMTGLELILEVEKEFDQELTFVLISGYSDQKLQDIMKSHPNVKALLRKPITRDDLQEQLRLILFKDDAVAA